MNLHPALAAARAVSQRSVTSSVALWARPFDQIAGLVSASTAGIGVAASVDDAAMLELFTKKTTATFDYAVGFKPRPALPAAFAEKLGNCSDERVVVASEGKLVTSRGPGTAIEFGLKLIELLVSKEKAMEVAKPMLVAGYAA